MTRPLSPAFPLLALALLLAACAQPAPPRDRFYRLEAAPALSPLPRPLLAGTLEVSRPVTDGVLSERALAFQEAGGALGRYRYDLWAEPPAALWQTALALTLRRAGIADAVTTPDLAVPPDWVVRARLLRFEMAVAAGSAVAIIDLAVVSARDGRLLLQRTYRAEEPCTAEPEAEVAALTRAGTRILADFATDMTRVTP